MNQPNISNQQIQQLHMEHIEFLFHNGIEDKSPVNLASIIHHLESMKPCGSLPIYFYDFWFNKLLTAPNETYINCINPQFDKIFEFSPRQKAEHIESYLKVLSVMQEEEKFIHLLNKSLSFQTLIEETFVEGIPTGDTFTIEIKKNMLKLCKYNQQTFFSKSSSRY